NIYYFCSKGCAAKFQADPQRYLSGAREAMHAAVVPPGDLKPRAQPPRQPVEYTCPMHPEVVSDRPGACPKCGMALEPRVADLDDRPNPELVDMTRRFWVGVLLAFPVFALTLGDMLTGVSVRESFGPLTRHCWQLALAPPFALWC